MRRPRLHSVLLTLSLALVSSGCATDRVGTAAAVGGVSGAAIGAGTGALIGNDGNSALVGAAIGAPVGVVLGVAAHNLGQSNSRAALDSAVERNSRTIAENQRTIDSLRGDIEADSRVDIDESYADRTYDGATVGNPFR